MTDDYGPYHVEPQDASHVVMDGEVFICRHCNQRYRMNLPCPVSVFAAAATEYANIHRHCEPRPSAP